MSFFRGSSFEKLLLDLFAKSGKPSKLLNCFLIICDKICDTLESFVWGSVLGTVFDLLTGGFSCVQKHGVFHHGPIVAAHIGTLNFFISVLPNNLPLISAVGFGVVRFIRTKRIEDAAQAAVVGLFISFAFMSAVGDPFKEEWARDLHYQVPAI